MKRTTSTPRFLFTCAAGVTILLGSVRPPDANAQTCSRTQSIACGATVTDSLGATEHVCHTFGGRLNEVVSVTAARVPGSAATFSPCWRVVGPNGRDITGFHCLSQAEARLTEGDGTYTIEVTESGNDTAGTYVLSFDGVSATLGGAPSCGEPIACGETLERTISTAGETDTFHFTARQGEVVALTTVRVASPSTFSPCWELFAPSGTRVAGLCAFIGSTALPETGVYTVKVYENGHDATGTYDLNLHPLSATFNGAATCPQATLACGAATLTGSLASPAAADTYVFSGRQNEAVSVTAVGVPGSASNFSPCWRVFGPNGRDLTGFQCGRQGEAKLTEGDGTYSIEVVDTSVDATGSYHLSFEAVSATLDGTPNCAAPIACGGAAVRRSLAVGETTTLQFGGTATGSVTITVAKTTGGSTFTPCWELFGPSGAKVRGTTCGAASPTLAETGVHTIKVFDSGYESPGTTDVTLSGGGCIPLCGDVNGDAAVDIGDALVVAQYDVGLRPCRAAPFIDPELCDVNADGACNIGDALRIAQCSVGLVPCTFSCRPFSCP